MVCSGFKLAWQDPTQTGGFLSRHQMFSAMGAPAPSPSPQWGSVAVSPADLEVLGSPRACQPLHAGIASVFEHAAATKTFRGEEAEQVDQNWRNSYLPGVLQAGSVFFVILENSSQKVALRARCSAGNGMRVCRAPALSVPCSPPQHDGTQALHSSFPGQSCTPAASSRASEALPASSSCTEQVAEEARPVPS